MIVCATLVDTLDGRRCVYQYGSVAPVIGEVVVQRVKWNWTAGNLASDYARSRIMARCLGLDPEEFWLPHNVDINWIVLPSLVVNGVELIGT